LQLNSGDDSAEKVLSGEAKNNGGNSRPGEKTFQLSFGVIAETKDKQKRDEKDEKGKYLADNVWDGCLSFLLKVGFPEIMVDERDKESGAEEDKSSAHMFAPIALKAVHADRYVKGEGEAENLEEKSKWRAGAAFEKPTQSQGHEIGQDEGDKGGGGALRANERLDHRHPILAIKSPRNKHEAISTYFLPWNPSGRTAVTDCHFLLLPND
jgi:hypothetical protein